MNTYQEYSYDELVVKQKPVQWFEFETEHQSTGITADLKMTPEDFVVEEQLKFELSGNGQHLCVLVEKRLLNTMQIVSLLARFFEVSPRDIGYFGLKDKAAVTRQWFSIDLAQSRFDEQHLQVFDKQKLELINKMPAFANINKHGVGIKIIEHKRNIKKFKIGELKGNHFEIVLRNLHYSEDRNESGVGFDKIREIMETRLSVIQASGFPNYFGEQRFGRQQQNIQGLLQFKQVNFQKRRQLRSRLLSTARALAFNTYLAKRITSGSARSYVRGDVLQFSDGATVFSDVENIEELTERLKQNKVVITGPLLGSGTGSGSESMAKHESFILEQQTRLQLKDYLEIIEVFSLKPARRPLIAFLQNLTWYFSGNDLFLQFDLNAGNFATSFIDELIDRKRIQGSLE